MKGQLWTSGPDEEGCFRQREPLARLLQLGSVVPSPRLELGFGAGLPRRPTLGHRAPFPPSARAVNSGARAPGGVLRSERVPEVPSATQPRAPRAQPGQAPGRARAGRGGARSRRPSALPRGPRRLRPRGGCALGSAEPRPPPAGPERGTRRPPGPHRGAPAPVRILHAGLCWRRAVCGRPGGRARIRLAGPAGELGRPAGPGEAEAQRGSMELSKVTGRGRDRYQV